MERNVRLDLTVEDVNGILGALGERPFAQVSALIRKIQEQASEQLGSDDGGSIDTMDDD